MISEVRNQRALIKRGKTKSRLFLDQCINSILNCPWYLICALCLAERMVDVRE